MYQARGKHLGVLSPSLSYSLTFEDSGVVSFQPAAVWVGLWLTATDLADFPSSFAIVIWGVLTQKKPFAGEWPCPWGQRVRPSWDSAGVPCAVPSLCELCLQSPSCRDGGLLWAVKPAGPSWGAVGLLLHPAQHVLTEPRPTRQACLSGDKQSCSVRLLSEGVCSVRFFF